MKSLLLTVAVLLLPSLCSADEILFRITGPLDSDNVQVIGPSRNVPSFISAFALRSTDEDSVFHTVPAYSRTISFHDQAFDPTDPRRIIVLGHTPGPLQPHDPLTPTPDGHGDPEVTGNSIAAVPEPGTLALLGTGFTVLGALFRRKLSHRN